MEMSDAEFDVECFLALCASDFKDKYGEAPRSIVLAYAHANGPMHLRWLSQIQMDPVKAAFLKAKLV